MSLDVGKRVMIIGAHPDDCELRAGGTALKLISCGHKVKFVSATNGDTGHHVMGGGQLAKVRREEMKNSAEAEKIEWEVLDIHNNEIEPSVFNRRMFIKCMREYRPDLVITHRPNDYHPDHRYTSILVQDSIFGLTIPNVCPMVPHLEKMPFVLYMFDSFKNPIEFTPDIVVEIDDVMDKKIKMLNYHQSQVYEWLPWINKVEGDIPKDEKARLKWLNGQQRKRDGKIAESIMEMLAKRNSENKKKLVCAEAFEICEYGSKISKDDIDLLFPFL